MKLAGIDLNLLVILDALLQECGVTPAARRVGLSQSATSHALGRLRTLLDDPILLRTKRGMIPTARAEAIAPLVRLALDEAEGVFFAEDRFEPATSRDEFRIGLDESALRTVLPSLISNVNARAPGVRVVVPTGARPESLAEDLEGGAVDVVISSHHPADARDLKSHFVIAADYVTISRKDHPTIGRRLSLARFCDTGHVSVAHPSLADIAIDGALAKHRRTRRIVLTVPEPAAVPEVVSRSDLIATLPRMLVEVASAPTNLVLHKPPVKVEPVPVFVIHHVRTDRSPSHRWFREQVAVALGSFPASG